MIEDLPRCATLYCLGTPQRYRQYCEKCRTRQWRAKNPVKASYRQLRRSAQKRYIAFDISLYDFTVFCIETGYIWFLQQGYDVTIDRKDPLKGYTKGNIQILTRADNTAKARREPAYGAVPWGKQPGDPF
jgi:hypothetical protein